MPLVITNTTDADGSQLPQIVVVDFSNGNIKLVSDPGGNWLQYLPLILNRRKVFRQAKANPTHANVHNLYSYQYIGLISIARGNTLER